MLARGADCHWTESGNHIPRPLSLSQPFTAASRPPLCGGKYPFLPGIPPPLSDGRATRGQFGIKSEPIQYHTVLARGADCLWTESGNQISPPPSLSLSLSASLLDPLWPSGYDAWLPSVRSSVRVSSGSSQVG